MGSTYRISWMKNAKVWLKYVQKKNFKNEKLILCCILLKKGLTQAHPTSDGSCNRNPSLRVFGSALEKWVLRQVQQGFSSFFAIHIYIWWFFNVDRAKSTYYCETLKNHQVWQNFIKKLIKAWFQLALNPFFDWFPGTRKPISDVRSITTPPQPFSLHYSFKLFFHNVALNQKFLN